MKNSSDLGRRIAEIAYREWWYFGSQYVEGENSKLPILQAKDGHGVPGDGSMSGFQQRVWSYFRDGVFPGQGDVWLDYKSWAWSGAFISYCFQIAGAGDGFPYSPAHHRYMMAGVRNRQAGTDGPGLAAYDIADVKPQIGDLLWKGRLETAGWGYVELAAHANGDNGSFRSHCDIVVDIDHDAKSLSLIGGNVRNRVLKLSVPLDQNGFVKSNVYTALLQNRLAYQPGLART